MDDRDLLDRYHRNRDETAFTELVHRHIDFVYAIARRHVGGDAHFAQEVVQDVFVDLARKVGQLTDHPVLKGWLYTSTRFAALKVVRREKLRALRENEAASTTPREPEQTTVWLGIRPALDEVFARLKPAERDAILLRYFENRGFAEIGTRWRISEDAARMRVERALDRIRRQLARRGITSTATVLSAGLTAEAGATAPSSLASTVAQTALTKAAALPAASALQLFMGTKTTVGAAAIIGAAVLLSVPGIGVAIYETRAASAAENAALRAQRILGAQTQHDQMPPPRAVDTEAKVVTEAARSAASTSKVSQPSVHTSNSPSGSRAPVADPRSEGARFLAAYPQARALLIESGKMRTQPQLLAIFRRAGLTSEQIDALNTRIWANRADGLTASPGTLGWNVSGLPPDSEMLQLLGTSGFAELQQWLKMDSTYEAANQVAAAVAYTAPPLTGKQIDALAHAMAGVKPTPKLAPGTAEWDTTMAPLRATMSPEQWQVAEGALTSTGLPGLIAWLQNHIVAQSNVDRAAAAATPRP